MNLMKILWLNMETEEYFFQQLMEENIIMKKLMNQVIL